MNENMNVQYVKSVGAFWRALRPWVKYPIVLVGLLIGVWLWFAGFSAMFPLIALIFLGSGNPALVLKVLVILAVMVSFVIVVALVAWLLCLLVYATCYLLVMQGENASMGDFIFKTKE